MRRAVLTIVGAGAILLAGAGIAADPTQTWDGLVQVPSKQMDTVFLQPGADFRGYTKIILDPTEVAFAKDWQSNYNNSVLSSSQRVSDAQVQQTISEAVTAAGSIFAEAWTKGGFSVVATPGPDVMRVKTGVVNITMTAPEAAAAGRTQSYAAEAGQATFYVEVRDSLTGALLGRAIDRTLVGNNFNTARTGTSNRADFRAEVQRWADISVRGVSELKALSPVRR